MIYEMLCFSGFIELRGNISDSMESWHALRPHAITLVRNNHKHGYLTLKMDNGQTFQVFGGNNKNRTKNLREALLFIKECQSAPLGISASFDFEDDE